MRATDKPAKGNQGVGRRQFLVLTAGGAATTWLAGCDFLEEGVPVDYDVHKPDVPGAAGTRPGQDRFVATSCGGCAAGCGAIVRVAQGRAVGLRGIPGHPVGGGGLCPRAIAAIQRTYHPERVRRPMKRQGARGSGAWVAVSWEEALAQISARLAEVRAQGPHRLLIACGEPAGAARGLWERWGDAFGTPNVFAAEEDPARLRALVRGLVLGGRAEVTVDPASCRYLISFGHPLHEPHEASLWWGRAAAGIRRPRLGARGKVVVVTSRPGRAPGAVDEWVEVRPGTHGALALGIACVLMREGPIDTPFLTDRVNGFDGDGVARLLSERVRLEDCARVCGVDAERIRRLAREFGAESPNNAAIPGTECLRTRNGGLAALAVETLNLLVGNPAAAGGTLHRVPAPLEPWPAFEPDEATTAGRSAAPTGAGLVEALDGAEPPVAAILHQANPVHMGPAPEEARAALSRVPFVVSIGHFLDETCEAAADLVLPDQTWLERWDLSGEGAGPAAPVVTLGQPAILPLQEERAAGEILLELARRIGGALAAAFPWSTTQEMVEARLMGLPRVSDGEPNVRDPRQFLAEMRAGGVWTIPFFESARAVPAMETPSGKAEMFPAEVRERLARRGAAPETLFDPLLAEDAGGGAGLVVLHPYRPIGWSPTGSGDVAWLEELPMPLGTGMWRPRVAIHPSTAGAAGLHEGDVALLTAENASVRWEVHVTSDVPPGIAAAPLGYGRSAGARDALGRGANAASILGAEGEEWSGLACLYGRRVRLSRAGSSHG